MTPHEQLDQYAATFTRWASIVLTTAILLALIATAGIAYLVFAT